MTNYYYGTSTSDTTPSSSFNRLTSGDTAYVAQGVSIAALGNYERVFGASRNVRFTIAGSIYSAADDGIYLGGNAYVTVTASGQIVASGYAIEQGSASSDDSAPVIVDNAGFVSGSRGAIFTYNGGSTVTNSGTAESDGLAVSMGVGFLVKPSAVQSLVNTGLIESSGATAVAIDVAASIRNSGTIRAAAGGMAIDDRTAISTIINDGTLDGDVMLGTSADSFDGRLGVTHGTVFGGGGNDTLYGGAADDVIDGGAGADYINGGAGIDTASYADATAGVTVALSSNAGNTGDAAGDRLIGIENLTGSAFADTLTGTAGANALSGGGGDDVLKGGSGDDDIDGGAGNDTLIGGTGNDFYDGGADTDTLSFTNFGSGLTIGLATVNAQTIDAAGDTAQLADIENLKGSSFADTLTGDTGANVLLGLAGNDTLSGGDGNDTIDGGAGDDVLVGGIGFDIASYASATAAVTVTLASTAQQDTIGAGRDTLSGFEAILGSGYADTLTGDGFANTLTGGSGDDKLTGGAGNDVLIGGTGRDTLDGGANDDVLQGGTGNDILIGGDGNDIADYSDITAGVTVNLALTTQQNTAAGGYDTLTGIEGLTGTNYADTLTGGAGADTLNGGLGNDTLNGGGGNDIIYGTGAGTKTIDGGANIDTLTFANASGGVNFNLAYTGTQTTRPDTFVTATGIENVTGSAYADDLSGNTGANTLSGGAGNDILYGDTGLDTLIGGTGQDRFDLLDQPSSANLVTITDFSVADDTIALSNGAMPGVGSSGTLAASAFYTGSAAHDTDDRIIYNATNGNLFYDSDGTGSVAQIQIASLTPGLALANTDFTIL